MNGDQVCGQGWQEKAENENGNQGGTSLYLARGLALKNIQEIYVSEATFDSYQWEI